MASGKAADAEMLDGLDSAQLSPATGDGRIADLALTGSPATVLSANVTTARSAALLVSAAVNVVDSVAGDSRVYCTVRFDGSVDSVEYETVFGSETTIPVVWAQPVGAGAHTVELWCGGLGGVIVTNAGMTVSAHV